jgi:inosine/xanthosine triphosphate pyrophosphatase family protein
MFYPEGYSLSLAQITPEEKATLSHRGLATKTLRQKIYTFASL